MTFKYRYRKQIIITCTCLLIVSSLVFFYFYKKPSKNTKIKTDVLKSDEIKKKPVKKEEEKEIMVDVKGEVNTSGIFTLKEGSRVIDAINLAGGLKKNANTSNINLSQKLKSEMVIYIYSNDDIKKNEGNMSCDTKCKTEIIEVNNCIETNENKNKDEKININTASLEDLLKISGIGESKAKNIIEYRETNGQFKNIEEIKNINGIGDSLFNKIKDNITI